MSRDDQWELLAALIQVSAAHVALQREAQPIRGGGGVDLSEVSRLTAMLREAADAFQRAVETQCARARP